MFGDVKGLVPVSQIPPLEGGKDLQSTYYVGQVQFILIRLLALAALHTALVKIQLMVIIVYRGPGHNVYCVRTY